MAAPINPANINVQDLLNRLNDFLGQFTTGSVDLGTRLRGINSAIEYLKRVLTLPGDKLMSTLDFFSDTFYYTAPNDFAEGLALYYDDTTQNKPGQQWTFMPERDILGILGKTLPLNERVWSWGTSVNNLNQVILFGGNLTQGGVIQIFSNGSTTGFTAQNNAQNFQSDTNITAPTPSGGNYYSSFEFDINPALTSTKMASIYWTVNLNFKQLFNKSGMVKLPVYLPSANLSSIQLVAFSDASDYYTMSATAFDDGSAFSAHLNAWKKVAFNTVGAVATGSPNTNAIVNLRLDFVENASFGSSIVSGFRIDDMYTIFPDTMDLHYLTQYKGTDSTGATNKFFLTSNSDVPNFANYVPDLLDLVAMRAAIYCIPSILSNVDFLKMYKNELNEMIAIHGKSFPRQRISNFGRLILSRPR